jgi:Asp-tRNA(Asn)/Glu-tRNA(Gln) amidotransferase A subunit family amidase
MARSVEDAARIFNVMAGYDPNDPFTEDGKREQDYTAFLDPQGLKGARIGVLRALVDTDDADPEVTALFQRALADLRQAGAVIVDPIEVANFANHLEDKGSCKSFRYDMYVYLQSLGERTPLRDVMEVYKSGRYSPSSKDAFAFFADGPLDVPPERWDPPCLPYLKNPSRKAFHDDVTAAMDQADVEVLIYPTLTNPPAHLEKARVEF